MNEISNRVSNELEKVVSGFPWYGSSVKEILSKIDEDIIFRRIGNAHTIAEIILHMTAWAEEVTDRLEGEIAKEPRRGDWPDPGGITWSALVEAFFIAHTRLQAVIAGFDEWETAVPYPDPVETTINYRETLTGLAQHHAYHLGQIALLNRQLSSM